MSHTPAVNFNADSNQKLNSDLIKVDSYFEYHQNGSDWSDSRITTSSNHHGLHCTCSTSSSSSSVAKIQLCPKMMVKLGSDSVGCDLGRIQDLFPADNLYLFDKDPLSPRAKIVIRKRSTTASRLQRALSGKNKIVPTEKSGSSVDFVDGVVADPSKPQQCPPPRTFIMDTAVQLTSGVQSQERHLFLFNDVMIVAKIRTSGNNYKLKEKVRVAEMWLSNCVEVVCEVAKSGEASFVMGWPTTNMVATFSSTHTRDLWLAKLKQLIASEQESGPSTTSVRVHYWDPNTKEEYAQNVSVSQKDTVATCITATLKQLNLNVTSDACNYQLWVKVDRDSAPYPLIGHESPFAIKMNCLYATLAVAGGEDTFNPDKYCRTLKSSNCPVLKCYFILRNTRRGSFDLVTPKKSKRVRKSPILQKVFRRSLSKPESLDKTDDAECLFGQSLTKLTRDNKLPKPIMETMTLLYEKGPYTTGIFRKSANARLCRELREKLNVVWNNTDCDLTDVSILVLAALLKDFLRSLPDCLLLCDLYSDWLALARLSTDTLKVQEAQRLIAKLPASNVLFLKYFLCVLWHVQRRCSENMMTASNLAVCVGPSLLWSHDRDDILLAAHSEASKLVPTIVEFLILRCKAVLGQDCLSLFGSTPPVSNRDLSRRDSGNEESDSLHSLQSSQSSVGLRRDDSSIDSLEHVLLGDNEPSPKLPSKTKMSLTNLSRDSGLTMSDTQLYTPDEEIDSEASSGRGMDASRRNGVAFQAVSSSLSCDQKYDWSPTMTKPSSNSSSSSGYRSVENEPFYSSSSNNNKRSVVVSQSMMPTSTPIRIGLKSSADYDPIYSRSCPPQQQQGQMLLLDGRTETNSRSQFPLGDRKEVIKRRLSRPRAWARPVSSSYSQENPSEPISPLRKSASEESLVSNYGSHSYLTMKRPVQHKKGPAPAPPAFIDSAATLSRVRPSYLYGMLPGHHGMTRSKSVHQFENGADDDVVDEEKKSPGSRHRTSGQTNTLGRQAALQWHHSRSTPHIEKVVELSYDSSTISDNDSTPHISRSNSRGKDYGSVPSSGHSVYNYSTYVELYGDTSSTTYEDVDVSHAREPLQSKSKVVGLRNVYDGSVRICNGQIEGEIHHAAPARIETSDEELEPPPLPPKPQSALRLGSSTTNNNYGIITRSSSEYRPQIESAGWYGTTSPLSPIYGPSNTNNDSSIDPKMTVISGKRVLTATQNIYDVPSWRIVPQNHDGLGLASEVPVVPKTSSRGRSLLPNDSSRGPALRAKSQPPPEDRRRPPQVVESIYDSPLAVGNKSHRMRSVAELGRGATLSAASARQQGLSVKRTDDTLRHGSTVGRTFRKEFSWSVSQLRSLFTRNRDGNSSAGSQRNDKDLMASHKMWAANETLISEPKVPPPYRAPPRLEAASTGREHVSTERRSRFDNKTSVTWTSRMIKGHQAKVGLAKSVAGDSQDSASGGEESYV